MSSDDIAIRVSNLSKSYQIYDTPRDRLKQFVLPRLQRSIGKQPRQYFREFWALKDVSFEVKKGETVGIIGRNGSGKSTLLQMICGTLNPTGGSIQTNGRIAALLELGSGFNPEFTGRENVYMNAAVLGLGKEEIDSRFDDIAAFADIGEFIEQPVKTYSSGMTVRLAFSVAANVAPEILIVDEALAVGDAAFQRKCISYMENFSREGGILLFVSHSLEQVRSLCNRAIYLKAGNVTIGSAKEMCDAYETDLFGGQMHGQSGLLEESSDSSLENEEGAAFELPECAIHYGNRVARISRCWTSDIRGTRKTAFRNGEKIVWYFQVEFDAFCNSCFYGLMIKNKEGINLFGTNTLQMGMPLSTAQAGEKALVKFEIDSHLGPGEYFLNCSVAEGDTADPTFLYRIVDAAIITIGSDEARASGLIAMDIVCKMGGKLNG